MLSAIFIISFMLGLLALIASILSQAEFWQRKEYRADRILAALISPELLSASRPYALALILAAVGWALLSRGNLPWANAAGLVSLAIVLLYHIRRAVNKGLFRPQLTPKAAAILLTTLLLTTSYVWHSAFPKLTSPLHWATVVLLVPVFTTLSVCLINLATNWRKQQIINRAVKLRQTLPDLKVIGLTGSYGKTSTKHFLSQLLSQATSSKEHRNSEFAIANDMLEQLNNQTKTYLVEMGAYRRSEIKDLAKITQPNIGLITNIGNQHLATFGSPENILKAKWELIDALPKDGIAVLNADDEKIKQAAVTKATSLLWYSIKHPTDVYVDSITIKDRSVSCRLHIKDFVSDVTIPLAGTAALGSAVAAVAAAHALGTDSEQIVNRLAQLKPYPRTMEIITAKQGSVVIDDSYSANEQGVLAAINHLKYFTQSDKRIVLVSLIELGRPARAVHHRIGQALAKSGATVYIYGNVYQEQLAAGQSDKIHFITQPKELVSQVTNNLTPQTIILLEGRLPNVLRKALL